MFGNEPAQTPDASPTAPSTLHRRAWIGGVAGAGMLGVSGQSQAAIADGPRTFGTMGKERFVLEPGRETTLYERPGAGHLTHMWFGGDWPGYLRTRIRISVHGEPTPSIDMELGLGHGVGFEDPAAPWGTHRIGKTGHPSGLFNTHRIPFGSGIRVTAQLADGVIEKPPFWWIIRGVEGLTPEIGGIPLPPSARLRLDRRPDRRIAALEEFDLCDVRGQGLLYQVAMAAKSVNFGYLEACMRAYLGDAREPMFLSSGLEDYFLGTYYFNRGLYHTPVAGLTHINEADHSFSAYRFHEEDPVFFRDRLRLTCRCGERLGDITFHDPRETTFSTYAWVYRW